MSKNNTSKFNANGLTDAQQRFCDAYLAHPERNGTRVYMQLHPHVKEKTARASASRMLANDNVSAYIEQQETEIHERLMAQYEATEERIIRELAAMAFARPSDFMSWGPDGVLLKNSEKLNEMQRAGLAEVKETKDGVSIKLMKKEALYLLGLRLGLFKQVSNAAAGLTVYMNHDLSAADRQ